MSTFNDVGKFVSRWIARARASREVLMIIFFGVTALSIFTNVARDYLSFDEMVVIDMLFVIVLVVFMYVGDLMDFFKSQQRDLAEMKSNFLSPQYSSIQLIRAEQFKVLGRYLNGGLSEEEFDEEIEDRTRNMIKKFRGGVYMNELTRGRE